MTKIIQIPAEFKITKGGADFLSSAADDIYSITSSPRFTKTASKEVVKSILASVSKNLELSKKIHEMLSNFYDKLSSSKYALFISKRDFITNTFYQADENIVKFQFFFTEDVIDKISKYLSEIGIQHTIENHSVFSFVEISSDDFMDYLYN